MASILNCSQHLSGFEINVGLSAAVSITQIPGQIGIMFRHAGGGSVIIGGASLSAANDLGLVLNTAAAAPYLELKNHAGPIYAVAFGTTATLSGFYLISEGNPAGAG